MKLEISLDDKWVNDYEATIAKLISYEIDACIKHEVKKLISGMVKENMLSFKKDLEAKMRKLTPAKLDKYLEALSKEGL